MPDPAEALRLALVQSLKQKGELTDSQMEAAFLAVPRHAFLPDIPLEQAYADDAIPVKRDPDGSVVSSASQPTMIAMMLRQLRLSPGDNVLEIGAGTGYNAALMQHIVGEEGNITTLELDKDMVQTAQTNLQRISSGDHIRVVHTDGAAGYAPRASYDRIIATVGVWDIPLAWVKQLKPKGIIVAPLWVDAGQVSAAFTIQSDDTLYSPHNLPCGFIQLRGAAAGPGVIRRVGSSSLVLISNEVISIDMAALHSLLSEDVEQSLLDFRLKPGEFSMGFLPYLTLNVPRGMTFVAYTITTNEQAYGITGHGFGLLSSGSVCFVPLEGHGEVHTFGALDALIALQESLAAWDRAGRPGGKEIRLRLIPIEQMKPAINTGKVFTRDDHYVHVWQDTTK
jgi:protein-L-isoaspartate(D-aspartate) O-methyltransferase